MLFIFFHSLIILSVEGVDTSKPHSQGTAIIDEQILHYETWNNEQLDKLIGTSFAWNDADVSLVKIIKMCSYILSNFVNTKICFCRKYHRRSTKTFSRLKYLTLTADMCRWE